MKSPGPPPLHRRPSRPSFAQPVTSSDRSQVAVRPTNPRVLRRPRPSRSADSLGRWRMASRGWRNARTSTTTRAVSTIAGTATCPSVVSPPSVGMASEQYERGDGTGDVDATDVAQSEQEMAGEVADDPAVQRVPAGVDVAVVADQHDEAEGDEHDAGDEQEVGVGVRVPGEPGPLDSGRPTSTSSPTVATTSK